METIKVSGTTELLAQEKLADVPELVQRYINIKERIAEGKYFRITRNEEHNSNTGAGIAMSNELSIEKRDGESWVKIYSTGMLQYRGAYASDIDNWDLSLHDPAILVEFEDQMQYAIRTGAGNVKVYHFDDKKKRSTQLLCFNIRDQKETEGRIELLQQVVMDYEAFGKYVASSQKNGWQAYSKLDIWDDRCKIFDANGQTPEYKEVAEKADVIVILASHYDRDYDAIADRYKLYVWAKGQGVCSTKVHDSRNRHPGGRFYCVGLGFNVSITNRGRNFVNLAVEVGNRSQNWKTSHDIRVEWQGSELSDFERKVEEVMTKVVQSHRHEHPLYKPTRITEKVINPERHLAAWVLFEQIDTDRLSNDGGEGYLGDQFRYSLWKMNGNGEVQLYEDHAYIRPSTMSKLTGTRGRDCSLKNLRLEGDVIKITHPKGDKVEEQQPEELTFNL